MRKKSNTKKIRQLLKQLLGIPPYGYLPSWQFFRADCIAGLSVAMLLIPQAMAYAKLAGLSAYYGLYAAFIPPMVAALFGSSRVLSTGPAAIVSLLTAAALQPIIAVGSSGYIHYVVALTFMAGIIQCVLAILRLGVVVNFLSYPVIVGFANAAALIIAGAQLGSVLGVNTVMATHYYQTIWQIFTDALLGIHWPTVFMAALTITIILAGKRWWPKGPYILLAFALTTILSWYIGYERSRTINIGSIANISVQKMLENYEKYPFELPMLKRAALKAQSELETTIKQYGEASDKSAEALHRLNEAQWELQARMSRHNLDINMLKRLRLSRLTTENNQEIFFVYGQMTPIGEVDEHFWRLGKMPDNGKLVVQSGGRVVGAVPGGLPSVQPVRITWDQWTQLFIAALAIALIGFVETIGIAKHFASQTREQLDVNRELWGQGLAKCVGSFFQAMPVSGGFSRTALNYSSGAKSAFASVVTGLVVGIVMLWFTGIFYYLPEATLAGVILVALIGMINFKAMARIWRTSRYEGVVSIMTFLLTLVFAPRLGYAILLGVLISLGVYLHESMRPKFCELIPSGDGDWTDCAEGESGCNLASVMRFSGSLYFANATYFEQKMMELMNRKRKLKVVIFDFVSVNHIDTSGLEALERVVIALENSNKSVWFTRVRSSIMQAMKRNGFLNRLEDSVFYKHNESALQSLVKKLGKKHLENCIFRTVV